MKIIKWGIAGTGNIAGKFASAFADTQNATLEAVFSRTESRAKKFAKKHHIKYAFDSYDALLNAVDIVYIASPHSEHYPQMLAAVSSGKAILCEKPFTVNAAQAKDIFSAAEKNGVFAAEALCTFYLPAIQEALTWINSGKIGTVHEIFTTFHINHDGNAAGRLLSPNLAGGALLDIGIYPLTLINKIFGPSFQDILTSRELSTTGVDYKSETILQYDFGSAHISAGIDYAGSNNAVIIGDRGTIVIPDFSCAQNAYLFAGGTIQETVNFPFENPIAFEIQAITNSLLEQKKPLYTAENTVNVLEMADAIRSRWALQYPAEIEHAGSAPVPKTVSSAQQPDWYRDAIFYHIYPLGFCGVPAQNSFSGEPGHTIRDLLKYSSHIAVTGANALYLGPVFESSAHGYDTTDYQICDRRLGTNEDLKDVVAEMHKKGIRVIFDGVFNHVGRDFWAFQDVREKKNDSQYKDWFFIQFDGNSGYNDGFWYEGWEGHFELVKLNLANPEVKAHLFSCIASWIADFDIDGLRLDVAYSLSHDFLRELRAHCNTLKPHFFLLGEVLHGDYSQFCRPDMLDSVTNYECYKGLYSSVNSGNMHEIGYSLNRQFGPDHWTLYKGLNLYTFLENHDVSRIASLLEDKEKLPALYALMFSMPGIPSIYYGGEWEQQGDKSQGDSALRPPVFIDSIPITSLTNYIAGLAEIRKNSYALCRGDYKQLYIQPNQFIFSRCAGEERVLAAFNFAAEPHTAHFNAEAGCGTDLITGHSIDFGGGLEIPSKSAMIIKI